MAEERRRSAIQRIATYGVHLADDQILLVRASDLTEVQGRWFLPGGGVEHGEHPTEALVREFAEETGLHAVIGPQLGIVSDVRTRRNGEVVHSVRIIYEVTTTSGTLLDECAGSSDLAQFTPIEQAREMPLAHYVIEGARMAGIDLSPR